MKLSSLFRSMGLLVALWSPLGVGDVCADAPAPVQPTPATPVTPEPNLLFNGWGLSPAGRQTPISDLALKAIVAPDQRSLVVVCAGFNDHGVALLDLKTGRLTQFLKLPEAWNGLAPSRDGRRFYVSGGDSGRIYVLRYERGRYRWSAP